ncbi:chaperone modulator CbpM [Polluticoccus soli]|uniref:chaperone modulator CbpM n=1 Tax=Polluticoccus soli TaxID=3034150 RepID=UPI0023E27A51|nr:chaperone modulator CbpM [Flavipsychrobacter sp. JY13-12]
MEKDDLIPAQDFCMHNHISPTIIASFYEAGLIEIVTIEGEQFLEIEHLRDTEKLVRLHTELDINLPGLEAIMHLLGKMEEMENVMRTLQQRLRLYEP